MKEIRCFISNAGIATSSNQTTPPVFELSDESRTFSRIRDEQVNLDNEGSQLTSFHPDPKNPIRRDESDLIIAIVEHFILTMGYVTEDDKPKIIAKFLKSWNGRGQQHPVSNVDYNGLVFHERRNYPDYLTFSVDDLKVSVWIADKSFKLFYPLYDIQVVTPFEAFDKDVRDSRKMLDHLKKFDFNTFGDRKDSKRKGDPTTYSRNINVQYRVDWDAPRVDCWFGFNIWGEQGKFDHLLREELYQHLKDLGLSDEFIEEHFPDLFKINEFFVVPDWTRYAIHNKTTQGSINSQVTLSFNEKFNLDLFLKPYNGDVDFLKKNSNDVPYNYNNILLRFVNGKYSKKEVQDFRKLFPDYIAVSTTHTDFARMQPKTQEMIVMLGYMLQLADSNSQTQLFNRILNSVEYPFNIIRRSETFYVTLIHGEHRYYCIPRFEHERISKENNLI